eukprot:Sdes_comp20107_c0_seq2m13124
MNFPASLLVFSSLLLAALQPAHSFPSRFSRIRHTHPYPNFFLQGENYAQYEDAAYDNSWEEAAPKVIFVQAEDFPQYDASFETEELPYNEFWQQDQFDHASYLDQIDNLSQNFEDSPYDFSFTDLSPLKFTEGDKEVAAGIGRSPPAWQKNLEFPPFKKGWEAGALTKNSNSPIGKNDPRLERRDIADIWNFFKREDNAEQENSFQEALFFFFFQINF